MATKWWHCSNCGYEEEAAVVPYSCALCKRREPFTKGKFPRKKDTKNTYDTIVKQLEQYEEGCEPTTTKSGIAE